MNQALALIILLIGSFAAAIPVTPAVGTDQFSTASSILESTSIDPDGLGQAFNVTYAQFDLYTENAALLSFTNTTGTFPGFPFGTHTLFSKVNRTQDGSPVAGTGFNHTIPAAAPSVTLHNQTISWVLKIPKGNYSAPFIRFSWNGTLGSGTTARYRVLNQTDHLQFNRTKTGNFPGGPPANVTLPCGPNDECLNVSRYIGQNLKLVFNLNSTSTGTGLKVHVNSIVVASVSVIPNPSLKHAMSLMNPTEVLHTGNVTLRYNATERQPGGLYHTFNQTAAIFYFPNSYTLDSIDLNATTNGVRIYRATPPLATAPLDQGICTPLCKGNLVTGNRTSADTRFISLNMSYIGAFLYNESLASTAIISARSTNAVSSLEPFLAGALTNLYTRGDTVSVSMRSQPGLNVSGSQTLNFTGPPGSTPVYAPFNNRGGTYVYDVTLPATTANLGRWRITGTFLSGYDFGQLNHSIWVDELKTDSISMSGAVGQGAALTVRGDLAYRHNTTTPAGAVSVTVFAIDAGSPPGPIASAGTGSGGLYVSNITLANGVFNQAQPLIVFFTVVNPILPTALNATLTIEHEWYSEPGGSHGSNVTFPLTLGDEPFTLNPSSVYRMDVTFASSGVQVTVKSVTTPSRTETRTLSPGSGVSPSRQHFGSFNIIINSRPSLPSSGGSPSTNSLRSPTYAYVIDSSLVPSRLMGFSPTVTTLPDGTFSATINGTKLLGANRLVVFALARDQNGITIGRDQVGTDSDSTFLTPTAEIPSEVTVRQFVTVTLSLESNSSLPVTLTVKLDLSGSGTVDNETVTIQPKGKAPATFTFEAPGSAGSYQLTFSSPQYGPLSIKTLRVLLLQSSLQTLVPVIVGLVATLIILGAYLIRKRPEAAIKEEKQRPPPGKSKPQPPQARNP